MGLNVVADTVAFDVACIDNAVTLSFIRLGLSVLLSITGNDVKVGGATSFCKVAVCASVSDVKLGFFFFCF
ncbi:hypothetical protein CBE90_03300 [Pasteurella multocida]|nr:hypothetical protein CBE90_03300 [Pasteurella multocida]